VAHEWIERARGYLAGRSARERLFMRTGALILLVLVGYGLVYEPMRQARAKLAARLPTQRAELRLVQVQAAEIERLRSQMGDTGKGGLERRVKSSAAALGLGEAITQFTPITDDRIELATQPLPTGTWIDWLADLERQGITVARCRITAGEQIGLAAVELTLTAGRR
jgi:type II secretory pathway component PulM